MLQLVCWLPGLANSTWCSDPGSAGFPFTCSSSSGVSSLSHSGQLIPPFPSLPADRGAAGSVQGWLAAPSPTRWLHPPLCRVQTLVLNVAISSLFLTLAILLFCLSAMQTHPSITHVSLAGWMGPGAVQGCHAKRRFRHRT